MCFFKHLPFHASLNNSHSTDYPAHDFSPDFFNIPTLTHLEPDSLLPDNFTIASTHDHLVSSDPIVVTPAPEPSLRHLNRIRTRPS